MRAERGTIDVNSGHVVRATHSGTNAPLRLLQDAHVKIAEASTVTHQPSSVTVEGAAQGVLGASGVAIMTADMAVPT